MEISTANVSLFSLPALQKGYERAGFSSSQDFEGWTGVSSVEAGSISKATAF